MNTESSVFPNIFYRPFFHILVIVILTFVAYSNTFEAPFVFDDIDQIVENPVVHDFEYFQNPSAAQSLPTWHGLHRRTVGYLTLALNYHIGGTDVTGYHVFNLVIHILSALLVYKLIMRTLRLAYRDRKLPGSAPLIGFVVALFFALHPIQTQAVTYIIQRLASLTGFFVLLSITSYIDARLNQESRRLFKSLAWFLVCIAAAAAAMKTKENAFTFPLVVALYEVLFLQGALRRRLIYLIPVLLTMLIIPLSMVVTGPGTGIATTLGTADISSRVDQTVSRFDYLFTQFQVVVGYLRLLIFPVDQSLDHALPIQSNFFAPAVFFSFLFLAALLILGLYLCWSRIQRLHREKSKDAWPEGGLIGFGILWFFMTLAVESSIIPIDDVMVEHRLYLPSVGFFLALITTCWWLFRRFDLLQWARAAILALVIALVAISAWATWNRNLVWQDEVALWLDTVKTNPQNARAYTNLGAYFDSREEYRKAVDYYLQALAIEPDFPKALLGAGISYSALGELDAAIRYYQKAIAVQPKNPEALYNLGVAYMSKGLMEPAARAFQAALAVEPTMSQARLFLNYCQRQMRK